MPVVILLMFLAPSTVGVIGMHQEFQKEQNVNLICSRKFKTVTEIKQCKSVLMKIER